MLVAMLHLQLHAEQRSPTVEHFLFVPEQSSGSGERNMTVVADWRDLKI